MKFGIFLSTQYPVEEDAARRFRDHLEQVRMARECGFHSVWAGQHLLAKPYQMLQSIPVLARVAAEAGSMVVGTNILLLALLNPVEVAETVASMDIICEGRFVFGVGLGYRDEEYDAFGVGQRGRVLRFERNLQLIQELWTGKPVHRDDRDIRLNGAQMTLQPVQKPRPPIWIAANNDGAVVRAARLGDAWVINPHAKEETLIAQIKLYRRTLREVGKSLPPDLPIIKELYLAPDREAAVREAAPYLDAKYKAYVQWGQHKALPRTDSLELPFEDLRQDRFILGTPADAVEQIEHLREVLGVNYFIFRMQWPGLEQAKVLRTLEQVGSHLIPRFTK